MEPFTALGSDSRQVDAVGRAARQLMGASSGAAVPFIGAGGSSGAEESSSWLDVGAAATGGECWDGEIIHECGANSPLDCSL